MLRFLGRGSAFAEEQNSAFFADRNELVLVDCPMSAFHKFVRFGAEKLAGRSTDSISIIITHTHGDHVGGVGTMIHYSYYVLHRPVTVIAPSDDVAEDLSFLLGRMEGCAPGSYALTTAAAAQKAWLLDVIPTRHSPELEGRCFGYRLLVDGEDVVYTGDTAVIEPFIPFLSEGTKLYSDVSLRESYVHITFSELRDKLSGIGAELFLMHLEDPVRAQELIKDTDIKLAPLFEGCPADGLSH